MTSEDKELCTFTGMSVYEGESQASPLFYLHSPLHTPSDRYFLHLSTMRAVTWGWLLSITLKSHRPGETALREQTRLYQPPCGREVALMPPTLSEQEGGSLHLPLLAYTAPPCLLFPEGFYNSPLGLPALAATLPEFPKLPLSQRTRDFSARKNSFLSLIPVLSNRALLGLLGIPGEPIEESGTS